MMTVCPSNNPPKKYGIFCGCDNSHECGLGVVSGKPYEVSRSYPYYLSLSMTPGDKPPSDTSAMTDEERALLEEVKK